MIQMPSVDAPMDAAREFLARARSAVQKGAQVVVGSEMMLTHYLCGDRYEINEFVEEVWLAAGYVAEQSKDIDAVLIFGGIALDSVPTFGEDGRLRKYNAAFVVQNGEFVLNDAYMPFAIKSLMPNYRIFDDSRHFYDLRKVAAERGKQLSDLQQPFRVKIDDRWINLGVMLCEDMWDQDYAQKPAQNLAANGADIIINLSCSNWSWRKNAKRDEIIRDICIETGLPFVYVNNVGVQNNGKNFITFDGASTVYNRKGQIVASCSLYEDSVQIVPMNDNLPGIKRYEPDDVEQMFMAVKVATEGFVQSLPKRLRKCIVAVSGGKDSGATLALMVHILGAENVLGLTMPMDDFTSEETKNDAIEQCKLLGVECLVVPIGDMVRARAAATGVKPGTPAYKTIQAMERLGTHAAIAADRGYFFTSNANMLESAFGYTTLNADSRGVFAPWGNCLAQDVYRILDLMNRTVLKGKILESIINRAPTDELSEDKRVDPFFTGHVGVNGYHDQMVRAIVAFRRGKSWFVERYLDGTLEQELQLPEGTILKHFPTGKDWLDDLNRCFKLYHAAFYKRVQSVPCPLVDKRSFGWDLREPIMTEIETVRFGDLVKGFANSNYPPYQVNLAA